MQLILLLPLFLAACGNKSTQDTTSAPVTETPPATLTFDNSTEESDAVVHDGGEARLVGRLTSAGGQRTLLWIEGATEQTVADPTWVLPPVAAVGVDQTLACWNALDATAEPAPDTAPSPRDGILLWCRLRSGGEWGGAVQLSGTAWLRNVHHLGSNAFQVDYFESPDGMLFGAEQAGTGRFHVTVEDGVISLPVADAR